MIDEESTPLSGDPEGEPLPQGVANVPNFTAAAAEAGITSLEDQERMLVVRAMEEANGNQSQAARILRIGRDALRYKLKKHGL